MAAKNMLDETYLTEDPAEPEGTDAPDAPEGEGEPAEPAATAPVTRTPITRRQKARERDESILKELKDTRELLTKEREGAAEREARRDRELAEMRGHLAGIASRPAPEARRAEPEADPDKLLQEANDALDRKDFNGYQRKFAEYNRELIARDPRFRQAPAPQQQGASINPRLQMVATQFADVMDNEAAFEIAKAHDNILKAQGVPEGAQRWTKAFEEGRRYLGASSKKPAPTFSTRSREVLSGVPTARGGSAQSSEGGEPGVTLTDQERQMAKRFKMKESEYAQHLVAMHPERIER